MIAYNPKEVLLECLVSERASKSGTQGFKEYKWILSTKSMCLDRHFGPRPGYQPDGGKVFHNVQCGL